MADGLQPPADAAVTAEREPADATPTRAFEDREPGAGSVGSAANGKDGKPGAPSSR